MDKAGCRQAVLAGIYPDDVVSFPEGTDFYPVFFDADFPIAGMSDVMPYPSQLYSRMTEEAAAEFERRFSPVVARAIEEFRPDVIFCHHLFLLTAMIRRDYPDLKIYGLCHGSDLRQLRQSDNLRDFVKEYIPKLDRVYALHAEQQRTIEELFGIPAADIRIAGSGYSSEIFSTRGRQSAGDIVTISYAGKLSRAKGIAEFMNACELLREDGSFPEFRVLLAGGEGEESIKRAIDKPYVSYLGMLSQRELAEVLRKSDIFVLPSYYEGLPLVLMEAMACGAVPVCTDLPGIREWVESTIEGSTAVFIPRPEMISVDEPSEQGKIRFEKDIADSIARALAAAESLAKGALPLPNIEAACWDSCAKRIFAE